MKHSLTIFLLFAIFAGCSKDEEPSILECGEPVSYQGYDYQTVLIGDRCWFAENLRSEIYRNGDEIPSNLSDSAWQFTLSGATAVFGEGNSDCSERSPEGDACDEAWSLNEYGRLYNWYAVDDARGLCPSGWHVATDGEWTLLTSNSGGDSMAASMLKNDDGWYEGGNGTNVSGFSALPGGARSRAGSFSSAGSSGIWWSSSSFDGFNALFRGLGHNLPFVGRDNDDPCSGYSVRCTKDTE